MHLRGSYTPLPTSVGGSVVAAINGETIDQWPTDGTGVIDRWVDVPDRLLQRYTNLGVAINIPGNTGRCGEFQPITLTIDGDSPVQTHPSGPAPGAGFQSAPQALMPRMEVGVGEDVFADTRRALSVLVGLQRMSALPMDTAVVPLQQAIDSPNPACSSRPTVGRIRGSRCPSVQPDPVSSKVAGIDGPADATTLTLDPGQRFGSLQMVLDGRAHAADRHVERSSCATRWAAGVAGFTIPVRWSRLTGTAVLAPAGSDPVTVGADEPAAAGRRTVEDGDSLPYWWLGAASSRWSPSAPG